MSLNRHLIVPRSYAWLVPSAGSTLLAAPAAPASTEAWGDPLGETTAATVESDISHATGYLSDGGHQYPRHIPFRTEHMVAFTVQELNKRVMNAIFGFTEPGTPADAFASANARYGWMRFQAVDQTDTARVLIQAWGLLKPTGALPLGSEDVFAVDFEFHVCGKISGSLVGSWAS